MSKFVLGIFLVFNSAAVFALTPSTCWRAFVRGPLSLFPRAPKNIEAQIRDLQSSENKLLSNFGLIFGDGLRPEKIAYASEIADSLLRFQDYSENLARLTAEGTDSLSPGQWDVIAASAKNVENRFLKVIQYMIWENMASPTMPTPNKFSLYAYGNIFVDDDSVLQPSTFKNVRNFYYSVLAFKQTALKSPLKVQDIGTSLSPHHVVTVDGHIHITRLYYGSGKLDADAKAWIESFVRTSSKFKVEDLVSIESSLIQSWQSAEELNPPEFLQYARNVWGIMGQTIQYAEVAEELFLVGKVQNDSVLKNRIRDSFARLEKQFLIPLHHHLQSLAGSPTLRTPNSFLLYAKGNIFADTGGSFQTPLVKRVYYFQGDLGRLRHLREEYLPEEKGIFEGLNPRYTITYDQCIHLEALYRWNYQSREITRSSLNPSTKIEP